MSNALILYPYGRPLPTQVSSEETVRWHEHSAAMENFAILDWWHRFPWTPAPYKLRQMETAHEFRDMFLRWAAQEREMI